MATIKWSPFRRIIEIVVGIYVESGFLSLNSTAKCAEATFFPPTLNFFSKISAYLALTLTPLEGHGQIDEDNTEIDTPFYGEVLTNGAPSKTCGGNQLATAVTDGCGTTYTSETPVYGPQSMWMRKVSQRYVPSSLYSGKLRLFVQAIYGSTRDDYEIGLGGTGLPETTNYKLQIDGYTLEHHLPTAGLFTDSNYNYYLMSCSVSSVTFYPLILSDAAQQWRNILKTHANRTDKFFAARAEAFILAYATIDIANPIIKSTGASVAGMPMGFGFKFNWAGNQAKIILHELDGVTGINTSRTLTLDIAVNLTVTSSVVGGGNWSNGTNSQFWSPDYSNRYLKTFGDSVGGQLTQSAVQMYGYYVDDIWSPFITSSQSDTNQTYADAYVRIGQDSLPGYGFDAPVNADQTLRVGTSVLTSSIGYSFGDDTITVYARGAHVRTWYTEAVIGNNTNTFTAPITDTIDVGFPPLTLEHGELGDYMVATWPDPITAGTWYWFYRPSNPSYALDFNAAYPPPRGPWRTMAYETGSANIIYSDCGHKSGLTETGSIMLAIPLDDCEAIIYGYHSSSGWSSRSSFTYVSESFLARGPRSKVQTWTGTGPTDPNRVLTGEEVLNNRQYLSGSSAQNSGPRNTINYGAGGESFTRVQFHASGANGWTHNEIDGAVIKEEITSSQGLPAWAEKYFLPGDVSGYFHPVVIGRSSAGGASIMYHSENANGYNANGYPAGVYSSVGWS